MHHIYCKATGEVVVTPSYSDAQYQFNQMARNNPNDLVKWDQIEMSEYDTMYDVANDTLEGKRIHFHHNDPR